MKKSDHFTLTATFKIEWKEEKAPRREIYKLRDQESLIKFQEMTSCQLIKCLHEDTPIDEACNNWYKEVGKIIAKCFKKIRITDTPPKNTIDYQICKLLMDIKSIRKMIPIANLMYRPVLETEVSSYEKKVAQIQGEKCKRIIQEETKELISSD